MTIAYSNMKRSVRSKRDVARAAFSLISKHPSRRCRFDVQAIQVSETICPALVAQIDVPGPNDNGPSPCCDEGPLNECYLGWLMGLEPKL
jgi:hypothetical protein